MNNGNSGYSFQKSWIKPTVRIGIVTVALAACTCFLPNIYLKLVLGIGPSLSQALAAWASVAVTFGSAYLIEPIAYYPTLGTAGSYIGILNGSMGGTRVPAAANAQEVIGVENGTPQAEVVSTLGIIGSSFSSVIIISVFVIFGSAIMTILPEYITAALQKLIMPSLFGAVFVMFAVKQVKVAVYALPVIILCTSVLGLPYWANISIAVFGNLLIAWPLYRKGILK